jgi:predicted GIY-YIG superfamily endonuclease
MPILNNYQSRIRHFWLYVLYLEGDKYYIGITTNFMNRFRQHGGPYGAQWTRKHHPLKVLELHDLGTITNYDAEKIEQDFFEQYRKKYGVTRVRGGRIVSTGSIFNLGKFYFNRQMLEAFLVLVLLMLCGVYIALTG